MTATTVTLTADVEERVARLAPRPLAVAVMTYNNAATVPRIVATARTALAAHFAGIPAAIIDADAGSLDGTPEAIAADDVPVVVARYPSPPDERVAVPFHGVPGRGTALRTTLAIAHRLGAHVLLILEADVTSVADDWVERLVRGVWDDKADLVIPAYARHRYDGTMTNLILRPLVRALYGRRIHQPLGGAQALSARLVEHLLLHPRWHWTGRDMTDLWIVGAAIADGFAVWEAWLGRRRIESRTRTTDLPDMMAETVGAIFTVMDRHEDLWLEVHGSEPVPALARPVLPSTEPFDVGVERLVDGFRRGVADLVPIWENIMAPDTLSDVLSLDVADTRRFAFPDDLWARVVYDFALGHHYAVVHRDHLLRSLVPLYLGRTAAFVLTTTGRSAEATEALIDEVGVAFERQKPYLVEHWR